MPARKIVEGEVTRKETKPAGLNFSSVRQWGDVVPLIQKMREEGKTVPEIAEELKVSYVLVNQLVLQSYKMVIDTAQVFERQEQKRFAEMA